MCYSTQIKLSSYTKIYNTALFKCLFVILTTIFLNSIISIYIDDRIIIYIYESRML
jgi:hypothetical protein